MSILKLHEAIFTLFPARISGPLLFKLNGLIGELMRFIIRYANPLCLSHKPLGDLQFFQINIIRNNIKYFN